MEGEDGKEKKEVREKLRVFVKYFVSFYEKSLTEYCNRLETQKSKSGKWAVFLNQLTETGKSGTEGIETAGIKAPIFVGINVLQSAIDSVGNKKNRDKLKKLILQLYKFKYHPDQVRNALVESGAEIFHSFESQFVQSTADGAWQRAMEKLAHDAVNRILSFSRTNFDKEVLTVPFITKGVIYGESKKYKDSSTGVPHIKPGHTVQTASSSFRSTAELFEKVGLVVAKDGKNKYYQKKGNKISCGYRRLFKWESLKKCQETHTDEEYQYILQLDDIENLNKKLKLEINSEDPMLMEDRLLEQIKQVAEKQSNEFKLFFTENSQYIKELLDFFENWRRENQESFKDLKDTIGNEQHKLIEKVFGLSHHKIERTNESILFDVKATFPIFTGRIKELKKIHDILQQEDGPNLPRIAAITGLGGIGKSELTKKYISQHMKEYHSNVIWINAETDVSLRESFCRLAKNKLKLPITDDQGKRETKDIVDDVYDKFSNNKSLFIFDNAERTVRDKNEGARGIHQFLPLRPNKPYVIITSRDQKWGEISTLKLDVLSNEEAKELIEKALVGVVKLEKNEAKRLAKELGNLPLALRQAVAFIQMQNNKLRQRALGTFTIGAYLEELKENAEKLLSHEQSIYAEYPKTVMNTWQITINKIETEEGTIGKLALDVLQIMAYLVPDNIKIKKMFMNLIDNEENMYSAVEMLHQYSLVNFQSGSVSIHRLVQTVTRLHLEELHENEKVINKVFHLLEYNISNNSFFRHSLLSHYKILQSHLDDWIKKETTKKDEIENKYIVRCLRAVADDIVPNDACTAIEWLDRALPIYEKHYGTESLEFAEKLSNRGHRFGAKKIQLHWLERIMLIFMETYSTDSLQNAKKLSNCENKRATECLDRALSIFEKEYGTESLELAEILSKVSDFYQKEGDYKRATELLDRALSIFEKRYGTKSLKLAKKLSKVSDFYDKEGDYKRATELLDRALPIFEKQYGTKSLEFARKLARMGFLYFLRGEHKRAVEFLGQALPFYENEYSSEDQENLADFAFTLFSLGNSYIHLDTNKVEEFFDRAVLVYKKLTLWSLPSEEQPSCTQLHKLHLTIQLGSLSWIKKLIDHGFNVLQRNDHDTVLHQAVYNKEVVRLILGEIKKKYPEKLSEAINTKDSEGNTPMMWAAKMGKTNSAKILLGFGPDLDKRNKKGMSALHWAVKGSHHEVLKLLLDYKAESYLKDHQARTPLDLAKEKLIQQPNNDDLQKIIGFLVNDADSQ